MSGHFQYSSIDNCHPRQAHFNNIELMAKRIMQVIKQTQMSNQLKLFDTQVSGKTAKFTDPHGQQVYKELSATELKFYCFMEDVKVHEGQHGLKEHIPRFLGTKELANLNVMSSLTDSSKKDEWMSHISDRHRSSLSTAGKKQYIVLQNLSASYRYPCVMDIKLGRKKTVKSSNKKFQNSTTNSHHFRINGMSNLYVQENEPHFISKYYFQKTPEQEIETHLAFFFYNGKQIDLQLVHSCIERIKEIVLALQCFKAGNFDSASLLLIYDAHDHGKFAIKIIDFDKYYPQSRENEQGDQNIIVGLKYIIWYLANIEAREAMHKDILDRRAIKLFNECEVVPQEKIMEFSVSPKSEKTKSEQSRQSKEEKEEKEKWNEETFDIQLPFHDSDKKGEQREDRVDYTQFSVMARDS